MRLPIVLVLMHLLSASAAAQPVRLIFDTDMGNDVDDALALAMIHAFERRGEAKLLAVTVTKDNRWAAPYVDAVNTFYGRGDVPIGVVRGGKTPDDNDMIRVPASAREADGRYRFPHDLEDGADAPEAVALLREVLAREADGAVTMVQVGFSTNLARLLDSSPDAHSPLDGRALVRRKVRLLAVMAGAFPTGEPEYNVEEDLEAARALFGRWPTPVVASGFEIGLAMLFPARRIERDFAYAPHHPVAAAYRSYLEFPYDRPTWDLTAVLYAVRPDDGYFDLSPPGRISVLDDTRTRFTPEPDGPHRYLIADELQRARTLEAMILLAGEPPCKAGAGNP